MDIIRKFGVFASALSKADRTAIIFHTDADGICAGVIAAKAVERICGKKPALFLYPAPSDVTLSKKMIAALKKKKINKAIIVDLNVDQEPRGIKEAEKFAQILILDHHTIQNDVNSAKTTVIKPQNFSKIMPSKSSRSLVCELEAFDGSVEPSKYAASKLVYDLFLLKIDISDLAWLSAVGIYGDAAEAEWGGFISEAIRKNKISLEEIKNAGDLIVYARSFDEKKGPGKAFREFYSARTVKDILKSELGKYAEKIEKELSHFIENREKLAKFYPEKKLVIYKISPGYNIKSELVNRLSRNFYPGMTCIVLQRKGKTASIGARNQSGAVSMNELMVRAAKGIPDSSGGGHIQAAGASIPNKKKWIEVFLKNIREIL